MTQEPKWTPGPWRWQTEEECLVGPHQIVMRQDEEGRKTFAYYGDGTEQANAHLIAAAPELYDALQWAMGFIMVLMDDSSRLDDIAGATLARAALAKARGETE